LKIFHKSDIYISEWENFTDVNITNNLPKIYYNADFLPINSLQPDQIDFNIGFQYVKSVEINQLAFSATFYQIITFEQISKIITRTALYLIIRKSLYASRDEFIKKAGGINEPPFYFPPPGEGYIGGLASGAIRRVKELLLEYQTRHQ